MPPIRTLFLMLDCEYPPRRGTPQVIWQKVSVLSRLGPVGVFSVGYNEWTEPTLPGVERWKHIERRRHEGLPLRDRALDHLARLISPFQYPHLELGLEKKANEELRQFIAGFKPTVAVIDHWLSAVIPSPLAKRDFPLIVASHDVEWHLLRDLTRPNAPLLSRMYQNAKISYFRSLEARLYRGADRIWTVSERDRRATQEFTGLTSQVRSLPAVADLDFYEPVRRKAMSATRPRTTSGPTIIYAGGYSWRPNADAAHALIAEIYPQVRASYPATRLLLVGRHATPQMKAAARADDHIMVTGEVDDIRPYLAQSDVVAVPLLVGGGMRTKIVEAFAAGIPVVSTTKGAQGIPVIDGRELLIRDGVPDFVAGIKELWDNPEFAHTIAERGFEFARQRHSMEMLETRVRAELQELLMAEDHKPKRSPRYEAF